MIDVIAPNETTCDFNAVSMYNKIYYHRHLKKYQCK